MNIVMPIFHQLIINSRVVVVILIIPQIINEMKPRICMDVYPSFCPPPALLSSVSNLVLYKNANLSLS